MKFGKKVTNEQPPPLPPSKSYSFKPAINKDYQKRTVVSNQRTSTRATANPTPAASANRPASKGSNRPPTQMKRQALKKELHGKKLPIPKPNNNDLKSRVAQLTGSSRGEHAFRPGIEQYIREYGSFGAAGAVKRAASAAEAV